MGFQVHQRRDDGGGADIHRDAVQTTVEARSHPNDLPGHPDTHRNLPVFCSETARQGLQDIDIEDIERVAVDRDFPQPGNKSQRLQQPVQISYRIVCGRLRKLQRVSADRRIHGHRKNPHPFADDLFGGTRFLGQIDENIPLNHGTAGQAVSLFPLLGCDEAVFGLLPFG